MPSRTDTPETSPADAHDRAESQVLLDVRERDERAGGMGAWEANGLPVIRSDGRLGTVI